MIYMKLHFTNRIKINSRSLIRRDMNFRKGYSIQLLAFQSIMFILPYLLLGHSVFQCFLFHVDFKANSFRKAGKTLRKFILPFSLCPTGFRIETRPRNNVSLYPCTSHLFSFLSNNSSTSANILWFLIGVT